MAEEVEGDALADEGENKRPATPAPRRWGKALQKQFLRELARRINVAAAARAVGISETTVYRHRAADAAFRAAWAAALDEGYARLETALLGRALNGTVKQVWYGGKKVGQAREFSDPLALQLLNRRTAAGGAGRVPAAAEDADAVRVRIAAKLAEMSRRLGGTG